ncbi:hypothetical protein F7725_020133 [Dissostichus mawsoni]|uniref:Uncharacterized protein n=1 Tax=Dissostichus mawsoni TaxID=36200 RepID=A0A7J5YCF9_DISMA|nr:hypothetical protein F7725_020133 [Dissostichus mawsoni]
MSMTGYSVMQPKSMNPARIIILNYIAQKLHEEEALDSFFGVSLADRSAMDAPVSQNEIENTIMKMASGKTPGDDGFGTEFYKCFKEQLSPYYCCYSMKY